MSWGVKTTCFKAPGVSLGGSGVSIGGVRILRVVVKGDSQKFAGPEFDMFDFFPHENCLFKHLKEKFANQMFASNVLFGKNLGPKVKSIVKKCLFASGVVLLEGSVSWNFCLLTRCGCRY